MVRYEPNKPQNRTPPRKHLLGPVHIVRTKLVQKRHWNDVYIPLHSVKVDHLSATSYLKRFRQQIAQNGDIMRLRKIEVLPQVKVDLVFNQLSTIQRWNYFVDVANV